MTDGDDSSSPARASSPGALPSKSVAHAKVALHLQRLVATAATSAAIATGCGFAVVDPVPPPARCPNLAEQLTVTGSYVMGANGLEIHVTITAPANRTDVSFADPVSVEGGTLVSSSPGAELALTLTPQANMTLINVNISVSCKESKTTPQKMLVVLTLPAVPKAGDTVTGTVNQQY